MSNGLNNKRVREMVAAAESVQQLLAIASESVKSQRPPDWVPRIHNVALALMQTPTGENVAGALSCLYAARDAQPWNPAIAASLAGILSHLQGCEHETLRMAADALQRSAASAPATLAASVALMKLFRFDEASLYADNAVRFAGIAGLDVDPFLVQRAMVAMVRGDLEGAEQALNIVRLRHRSSSEGAQSPLEAAAELDLAAVHAARSNWDGFLRHNEARWRMPGHPERPPYRWDLVSPLEGKRVLLRMEQGIGDQIMLARFIPWLRRQGARTVVVEASPALHELLLSPRLNPGPTGVIEPGRPEILCDVVIPAFDLIGIEPRFLSPDPYLESCPEPLNPANPRIGLCWQGSYQHRADWNRSMPIETIVAGAAHAFPGAELVSLQAGRRLADNQPWREIAAPWCSTPALRNFTETCEVIDGLDAVVSVDTAVAHLAGAMGKPCYLLLAYAPEWRWARGGGDLYASIHAVRQSSPGDWRSAMNDLCLITQRKENPTHGSYGNAAICGSLHQDVGHHRHT